LVEFELSLPKQQNVVWLPKEIVNALGRKLKLVSNSESAVIYANGADLARVVASLRIIITELEFQDSKRRSKRPEEVRVSA
jgi:hypothetical protein